MFEVVPWDPTTRESFQSAPQRRKELLNDLVAASWMAGDTVLPSGSHSSYFISSEAFLTKVTILRRLASMLADIVPNDIDRVVACLPGPDLVLATAVALETGLPLVIANGEAMSPSWLGELHPGETVVVVEGVVSSGTTAHRVVRDLVAQRVRVSGVVAAVDRDEGARRRLHEVDAELVVLFEADEVLAAAPYRSAEDYK